MSSVRVAFLLALTFASGLQRALGGFAHHPFTRWTPLSLVAEAPVGQPCKPGVFPCAQDFRDPTKAWLLGDQLVFLFLYAAFWLGIAVLVYCRQSLRRCYHGVKRWVLASRSRSTRAGSAEVSASPLLDGDATMVRQVSVGPQPAYPADRRVVELFKEHAESTPDAIALVLPGTDNPPAARRVISYRELAEMIEELAQTLNGLGITTGSVVVLSLQRSVGQLIAVFGVLASGAAYLPIDSEAPDVRKLFVISESEAAAVIAERGDSTMATLAERSGTSLVAVPMDGCLGGLEVRPTQERAGRLKAVERVRPEATDMAMLMYTSGTTGTPKGIIYDHAHLMHGVWFFKYQAKMSETSVALLKSPYFWAVIEYEMFPALVAGGSLVVTSPMGHKSVDYLVQTIAQESVTTLLITPQVLDLLLDIHQTQSSVKPLRSLQHILTVGEPLSSAVANRVVHMRGCTAILHNLYGASEGSLAVYTVPQDGVDLDLFPRKVPAGLPQPHVKVYVLRVERASETELPRFARCPDGETGEICFGGILAAGYWKREELTQQKFVESAEFGRLYLTGDLGRWHGGLLEVVGRTDRQVKVRGVRVEPEEVEMVLKRFSCVPAAGETGASTDVEEQVAALKEVAVVASSEPSELVAFVSCRTGVGKVTSEMLKAHCQAGLNASYVPKFFQVLDEGLPLLANGKINLQDLRVRADQLVSDQGEMVMDSLGQMKQMSQWAIFENAVIHRCYAYWMIGVLFDHFGRCAMDADASNVFFPYCTTFARRSIKPWTEVLIRSFGNDQDLFGFIMLGAYQDSRPDRSGRSKVNFGLKDLFVFGVYMAMALPITQMMHFVFWKYAWPINWERDLGEPTNAWNYSFMQQNSATSDHRWYLLMVLEARLFMQICEWLKAPGWLQSLIILIPCCLPSAIFEGGQYAFDVCEASSSAPIAVKYIGAWVFRNWGSGCPVFWRWVHWYTTFYVWCFHFLRPAVKYASRFLPKGPTWAALALGTSMTLGVVMALFHYPNNVLENGTGMQWVGLELGVDIIQPSLFALGMTFIPLNMAWWGNTTLGCYCFHFYFKDQTAVFLQWMTAHLDWDPSGLIPFILVVAVAVVFTSVLGPFGHYLLLSPQFAYARVRRLYANRSARSAVQRPTPGTTSPAQTSLADVTVKAQDAERQSESRS